MKRPSGATGIDWSSANVAKVTPTGDSIGRRSMCRNAMPAIIAIGARNSVTTDAVPNAATPISVLNSPASISAARPATSLRRAIAGTAANSGAERQVSHATCQSPWTGYQTVSG